MDFSFIRQTTIDFRGLEKVDKNYYFYYDETNNPRRFKISENGFNLSEKNFFILGGIVFENGNQPTEKEISKLYKMIDVSTDMKEVKFAHIQQKSKKFLYLIRKLRVRNLLNWIYDNNYWIHYYYQDNFYYSIVDIVDSMEESFYGGGKFLREIKNALYIKVKENKEAVLEIFRRNNYPNIEDDRAFVTDILNWIEEVSDDQEFFLEYFRQSIKSYRKKELALLKDNEPLITIPSFSSIYLNNIFIYCRSQHTFDEEDEIEDKLNELNIEMNGRKLENYLFVESSSNKFIQISDLIVGIIRIWLSFIDNNDIDEMKVQFDQLTPSQRDTLRKFSAILNNSLKENFAFKYGSGSNDFERKVSWFLDYGF